MNRALLLEKKTLMLGGILVFLFLVIYFRLLLGPAVGKMRLLRSQVVELEQRLKTTRSALARVAEIEKETARLRQFAEKSKSRLPNRSELPELLEHLSKTAEKSKVKIIEILPTKAETTQVNGTPAAEGLYEELPIAFSARSGYHELGTFLNQLENSERIFTVKDIEIKSDTSDQKRHHVRLVVGTFVQGEKEKP